MRFKLLRKIQSNEQWTEENGTKSGTLLNHVSKYLLKIPPTKNHQAWEEGEGGMTTVFSDLDTEK